MGLSLPGSRPVGSNPVSDDCRLYHPGHARDCPATRCIKTPASSRSPVCGKLEGKPLNCPNTFRDRRGTVLAFRPIRPHDVDAIQRLFKRLSPEEIRMRFQYARNELPDQEARRLCTLDPSCEAAFVLMDFSVMPEEMRGVGRIYVDDSSCAAEYAVLVEHRWTGRGLGAFLMSQLVAECRRRGLREMYGQVLVENRPMLDLCRDLGFQRRLMPDEPGTAILTLKLD